MTSRTNTTAKTTSDSVMKIVDFTSHGRPLSLTHTLCTSCQMLARGFDFFQQLHAPGSDDVAAWTGVVFAKQMVAARHLAAARLIEESLDIGVGQLRKYAQGAQQPELVLPVRGGDWHLLTVRDGPS